MPSAEEGEELNWDDWFAAILRRYSELASGSSSRRRRFVNHVKSLAAWEKDELDYSDSTETFPTSLSIAFAVCHPDCGAREFVVEGGTQECQRCGRLLFRLETRTYRLDPE